MDTADLRQSVTARDMIPAKIGRNPATALFTVTIPTQGVLMSKLPQIVAMAAILSAGITGEALAHAHLKSATPAENAVVTTSPAELDLTFSEGLDLKFSGATVTAKDKSTIATDKAKLATGDDKTLVIPVPTPLQAGAYTVDWHVLSTDGHKTKGSYTFTVKP
jgi:methionine-rich copper-binding protein CopC